MAQLAENRKQQHSMKRVTFSVSVTTMLFFMMLQVEMKLKAEINILLRSNSRLKADKAADAAQIEALSSQLSGLKQQLVEAAAVADKLRGELAERDGVIGDNYASLQGLRRRVQELETHKFVLGYKVSGTFTIQFNLQGMQCRPASRDSRYLESCVCWAARPYDLKDPSSVVRVWPPVPNTAASGGTGALVLTIGVYAQHNHHVAVQL
jgi:hypothetical protein